MDDPQAVGRCGCPEVVLIDDRNREPAQTGIPRGAGTMDACADHEKIKRRVGESREVAPHAPLRVMPGSLPQQVPGPAREARQRRSDPLTHPVGAPIGGTQVDDDLTHQTQSEQLDTESDQQDSKKERGPVGNSLALEALDQQN
jgi:hypothetical protein